MCSRGSDAAARTRKRVDMRRAIEEEIHDDLE